MIARVMLSCKDLSEILVGNLLPYFRTNREEYLRLSNMRNFSRLEIKNERNLGYYFSTKDIQAEYNRLKQSGVTFRGEPEDMGPVTKILFEDTCGNIINLVQLSF